MTDANRKEAQEELRQVIAESFANKSLWTTDWDGVQLQRFSADFLVQVAVYDLALSSLLPKAPPMLKRKLYVRSRI